MKVFIRLTRNLIAGILLFNSVSNAAVRGEWNTENEAHLTTTTKHARKALLPSQRGDQRQLGFVLSKRGGEREWTRFQNLPETFHHSHHRHHNPSKPMNEMFRMSKKIAMPMPMPTIKTMEPTSRPTAMKMVNMIMMEVARPVSPPIDAPIDVSPIATETPLAATPTATETPVNFFPPNKKFKFKNPGVVIIPMGKIFVSSSARGSRGKMYRTESPVGDHLSPVGPPASPTTDDSDASDDDTTWGW
jgi:hypothetical protein